MHYAILAIAFFARMQPTGTLCIRTSNGVVTILNWTICVISIYAP